MAIKAGVWIDHQQAIVVLVTGAGQEIKKLRSELGKSGQTAGGVMSKKPYTKNDFVAEDRREQKLVEQRKKFYDEVLASLQGAESILILGPGEAKLEFNKRIQSRKLRVGNVALETTDKLTDRQVAAKVAGHFAAIPAQKSAAPKKAAPKKPVQKKAAPKNAAKPNPQKPAKKSRK